MNKRTLGYLFSVCMMLSVLYSCKVQEADNVKIKIKPRSSKFLVNKLLINEFDFNTVSSKVAVQLTDSVGKETSFKAHLRIQKDSLIWISITPLLGIEIARVVISQDSVKLINRSKSEYFVGDFDYINKLFRADLDYQMLEALLLGNSLDFEMNNKIRSKVDKEKDMYYLSTVKKRKLKKDLEKEKDKLKKQAQALWLDPVTFKITEIVLTSSESDNTLKGRYKNFKDLGSQSLPYTLHFELISESTVNIDLKYSKFAVGRSLSFPFKISPKYEQITQ